MHTRLHPAARRELAHAAEWLSEQGGAGVAKGFIAAYELCVQHAIASPQIGTPDATGARMLRFKGFPYTLVYRSRPDVIVIVAVAHQRRRPQYWTNRS